jgi:beta-lactamase regulating signal transducer with metallopeptidase domain
MIDSATIVWLNDVSSAVLTRVLEATLLGSLLVVTSVVLFRLARTVSASTRHFGLLLAILSPVMLPLLASVLPQWHVLPGELVSVFPAQPQTLDVMVDAVPQVAAVVPSDGVTLSRSQFIAKNTFIDQRFTTASVICAIWITGVMISLALWGMGVISLGRLRRQSTPCSDRRLEQLLRAAIARIGVKRDVRLVSSDRRSMPMQWGSLRPMILLPSTVTQWSRDTIETVLLHELAHVRRFDCLTHGVALLTRSLFWFNPLMWWAVHRLRSECERACDDLLLTTGSNACDYADALLFVTRSARDSRRLMFVAMGMSTASELEWRIRGILDRKRARCGLSRRVACLLASGFSVVLCSVAVLRCQAAGAPQPRTGLMITEPTALAAGVPGGVNQSFRPEMWVKTRASADGSRNRNIRSDSLVVSVADQPRGSSDFIRIGHVDDSAEGRRSIAGSGHAVRFNRPKAAKRVAAIELFASRYGTIDPPNEDFHIYLLDEKQRLIAAYPVAYSEIVRGPERWYTMPIPACKVPEQFYVAVAFNPHRTKGIYLGYDESVKQSNSLIGRPTTGFRAVEENREWMVRAVMIHQRQPANPFEDSGT